jgi:putative restriction endonuclease
VDHSAGDLDRRVKLAAFDFLAQQTQRTPDGVLPRTILATGFSFDGTRVPLIGPQGIFKLAILPEMPLSIATVPIVEGKPRPYEDGMSLGGLLLYRYRGTDSSHRDNVGLRLAMRRRVPLIYRFGVVPGQYLSVWPVYIVADDPARLASSVAVDDAQHATIAQEMAAEPSVEARRQYLITLTQRRLHQESFRQRVLLAYQTQCAICRLRHAELLEAAHILPDGHPKGRADRPERPGPLQVAPCGLRPAHHAPPLRSACAANSPPPFPETYHRRHGVRRMREYGEYAVYSTGHWVTSVLRTVDSLHGSDAAQETVAQWRSWTVTHASQANVGARNSLHGRIGSEKETSMHFRILKSGGTYLAAILLTGCAALNANVNAPVQAPLEGTRVVVFPFPDPYYKTRQIQGIGLPFTTVFVGKLQAAGVLAEIPKDATLPSASPIDLEKACKYATEHNYDAFMTGMITEWIDGATQWSGTVDVAALTVNVYRSTTCELSGSASGRQNGQWFTFVNAPTTRFFAPLSESIVAALLNKRTTPQR